MIETKRESQLHKKIGKAVIDYFGSQRWRVTAAAYEGYDEPPKVGRHEPDVIAVNTGRVIVYGEAKTGDGDIGTQHSREQYHDFSSRVMKGSGAPCPLYLCLPTTHKPELQRVLAEEGLARKSNIHILVYS